MPISDSILERLKRPSPRLLYGISARHYFPQLPLSRYLQLLTSSPADIIQWREKDLSLHESLPLIREGIKLAHLHKKLFLVNAMVEVALEERTDGVHLPGNQSVNRAVARRSQSGNVDFLIGKSVHSLEEGVSAEAEGADYILLSPIFPPLSKQSETTPIGLHTLRRAVRRIQIPVFALGGIESSQFEEVFQAGAAGVAGISWLHAEMAKLDRKFTTERRSD